MDLTLQQPGDYLFVQGLSERGIKVADEWYAKPLILAPNKLIPDWPVNTLADLDDSRLEPVFELEPDILLIGTGQQQHFLPAELMMSFYQRNIGAEVMNTAAACRTYNVLASEERRVVAALLPLSSPGFA